MSVKVIRAERNKGKIRAAAYIRVSKETEKQDGSYEAQSEYYERIIHSNEEWVLAGIYGDRASGTHAENREAFQQMLQDATTGKIDLILCKSVSRWGRNAIDALTYVQMLAGNNVHIIFEQEGIDTRQPGMLLQLALASEIAQRESQSLSENIKWVYRKRAARGIFMAAKGRYFGYNTDNGDFTPDDDAKHVQYIFKRYAEGAGTQAIANELKALGVLTRRNNPFTRDSVRSILSNEVYVGDVRLLKTESRDVITNEIDKITMMDNDVNLYLKNHHEGIVDRELWNIVQERLKGNKEKSALCSDIQDQILKILEESSEISARGIGETLNLEVSRIEYYLRKLRREGRITRQGSDRKGKWIVNET